MKVSHGGRTIDAAKQPKEAIQMCLSASSGCGSKANAWAWADDAIRAAKEFLPEIADNLSSALGNDPWPNIEEAQKLMA